MKETNRMEQNPKDVFRSKGFRKQKGKKGISALLILTLLLSLCPAILAYGTVADKAMELQTAKAFKAPKTPKAPKKVKAVATGTTAIKLTWKKVKKAKGYVVYRAAAAKGKYVKVKIIKKGGTVRYANKGLKAGTAYFYKVKSFIKVKQKKKTKKKYSKFSAVATAKTKAAPVPAPKKPGAPAVTDFRVAVTGDYTATYSTGDAVGLVFLQSSNVEQKITLTGKVKGTNLGSNPKTKFVVTDRALGAQHIGDPWTDRIAQDGAAYTLTIPANSKGYCVIRATAQDDPGQAINIIVNNL